MRRLHPQSGDVDVESSYDDVRSPRDERPCVFLNMVESADGAIAVDGRTKAMSSPADNLVFHLLRSIWMSSSSAPRPCAPRAMARRG